MAQVEHIEDRCGDASPTGKAFFGEQEADNAKNAFISGFFSTVGVISATGLMSLLVLVAQSLLSGGKGQDNSDH